MQGHEGKVKGAIELQDDRVLSWSEDKTLRLWSNDGEILAVLEGHSYDVKGALELHDGRILSWSSEETFRLWSQDGEILAVLEGHEGFVGGALELHDGRILSWEEQEELDEEKGTALRLWSNDGEPLAVLEGHKGSIGGALELQDGRILSWIGGDAFGESDFDRSLWNQTFVPSDTTLRLWSAGGEPLVVLEGHESFVSGTLELQDGRILSWAREEKVLRLWSAGGESLAVLEGHEGFVGGALELQDGRILSWAKAVFIVSNDYETLRVDKTLRLWNIMEVQYSKKTNRVIPIKGIAISSNFISTVQNQFLLLWRKQKVRIICEGHRDYVRGALELYDGRILSWAQEEDLLIWGEDGQPLAVLEGHENNVEGAFKLNDGRILSVERNNLRLWSEHGEELAVLKAPNVTGVLALPNRSILSWTGYSVHSWDIDHHQSQKIIGDFDGPPQLLALESGKILSWSEGYRDGGIPGGNTLRLWSMDGEPLDVLEGHVDYVSGALELHDGKILSWGQEGVLRLWSEAGDTLAVLEGHEGWISGALELRDGKILSWGREEALRLWSEAGDALAVLEGHEGWISGALELRDGSVVSWTQYAARIWNIHSSINPKILGIHDREFNLVPLHNGRLLSYSVVEGGSIFSRPVGNLRLWSQDGEALAFLEGHEDMVKGILELEDGRILSWEPLTLRLWSRDGEELAFLEGHEDMVKGVLELEDGRILSWDDYELLVWSRNGELIESFHKEDEQQLQQHIDYYKHTDWNCCAYRDLAAYVTENRIDFADRESNTLRWYPSASNPEIVGEFQDSVAVNSDNKIRFLERVKRA